MFLSSLLLVYKANYFELVMAQDNSILFLMGFAFRNLLVPYQVKHALGNIKDTFSCPVP